MTDADRYREQAHELAEDVVRQWFSRSLGTMNGWEKWKPIWTAQLTEQFAAALAADGEQVAKEHEWVLKEIVEWGMQTETTELDLTTAEFGEVWRGAKKLLAANAALQAGAGPLQPPEEKQ